jgi:hypothetical protein
MFLFFESEIRLAKINEKIETGLKMICAVNFIQMECEKKLDCHRFTD